MAVRNHAGHADGDPRQAQQDRRDLQRRPPAITRSLGWLVAVVAIAAGIGWLYVLEKAHVLGFGPRMSGALPLEELASRGAQPLVRMALAWLPAGVAATAALAWIARVRAELLPIAVVVTGAVILFPMTAALEALTRNERFS